MLGVFLNRVREELEIERGSLAQYSGRGVTVAVIDSGIANHPDFYNRIVGFRDFVSNRVRYTNCYDDASHGTHVSGIIAGSGACSREKYRGIAYDANLVVAKVLDRNGNGEMNHLLRAIDWIIRTKRMFQTRIVNISMGIGELKDLSLQEKAIRAIENLWEEGLVVVTAAGNNGPKEQSISPLGSSKKIITVGCYEGTTFPYNTKSCEYFSGRGPTKELLTKPDLVTTGTNIVSCNNGFLVKNRTYERAYGKKTGTSMATPIVSGACALYLEKYPNTSNDALKQKLIYSAIDCGEDWSKQGFGKLNLKGLFDL